MSLTVEEALRACTPHPEDEEVLVTDNPEALIAIRCQFVKAVIWERQTSNLLDIANTDTALTVKLKGLYLYPNIHDWDLECIDSSVSGTTAPFLADLVYLAKILQNANAATLTRGGYLNERISSFHIDSADRHAKPILSRVRLHTAYTKNMALEWVPGKITIKDYFNDLKTRPHQKTECTKAGDVIIFKGALGNHDVPDGFLRGFMHKGQNTDIPQESLVLVFDNQP